eukprot:sb/3469137/
MLNFETISESSLYFQMKSILNKFQGFCASKCHMIWQEGVDQEPPETSKQPITTRYLGHVTGYQPIRDQYFLNWSVSCGKGVLETVTVSYTILCVCVLIGSELSKTVVDSSEPINTQSHITVLSGIAIFLSMFHIAIIFLSLSLLLYLSSFLYLSIPPNHNKVQEPPRADPIQFNLRRKFSRSKNKLQILVGALRWKTLKSGCLSLLTIRSFGARDGLGLTVRVWLGFGLGGRLGLSIL